jgi:hypothetical protein
VPGGFGREVVAGGTGSTPELVLEGKDGGSLHFSVSAFQSFSFYSEADGVGVDGAEFVGLVAGGPLLSGEGGEVA